MRLVGDVPIYVAAGSCDHEAHPELFLPGDFVAGAPPDPLNDIGQKWGNPLYDWDALAREDYRWWTERLRRTLALVDVFRIDHFRGFAGYWAVPAAAETAREGHWEPGPGSSRLPRRGARAGRAARDRRGSRADHARMSTSSATSSASPAWWSSSGRSTGPPDNPFRLENHRVHQVVYTSTHDTETLAGAFPHESAWALLELALSSPAALAMVPCRTCSSSGPRRA